MNIGFTGTRAGMSEDQKRQLRAILYVLRAGEEFHHGAARGADEQAAKIASEDFIVVGHPAGSNPLTRNKEIVSVCQVLIAAPLEDHEVLRSGTWATVRYARKARKPVIMLSRGSEITWDADQTLTVTRTRE